MVARYQIKPLIARQGYTLRRLADETKLSEPRLRAIANNRVENVTIRTLEIIAATLQVPLREVFEPASLDEVPTIEPEDRPVD
ncbi:MAG TPA: helix-turn-helix transcriptional regulator [Chloroflexota bacterium]|jgi:transcriptional regulator with XRE-family HTH domain|nr:helix-turn-helix transcriptional regulator [Chloroflexota bacterium]